MTSVSALVSGLDAELRRLGYKDSTMVWYRGAWRRMGRYFAARGVQEFSLDVAMAWVDEACGFFAREQAGTLKRTDVYLFRVAQMLEDYAVHGAVLRRYNRSVGKLDGPCAEAIARFQEHLRSAGRSASTVKTYGTLAGEFVAFTGTRGGLACCDAAMIGAFVATLAGYQFKTVEQKLCAVRSFLRFASAAGLADAACLDAVPAVRSSKKARIPSVWDPGQVARIVEAIDRDNPCGKRDYAIILLTSRLGLRGVDIRRLEFADFDWAGNRLAVTQAKTGHTVWLPLLKEVGWAVIDYVRHGRPACDCPQVFVRHLAPIGPFSDDDHLHQILVKHARVARVPLSDKRRHGMHSLRHTLATRLKRRGVASDASFPERREDSAVREAGPGVAGNDTKRQGETAGQKPATAPCCSRRNDVTSDPVASQARLMQLRQRQKRINEGKASQLSLPRPAVFSVVGKPLPTSLEGGTPVEQIADILGHQSVESTGVYLKTSLGLLGKCALDPDEPGREVAR